MNTIEGNVRDSAAAKELHATIGELVLSEIPKLPSGRSREIFWRLMMESIERRVAPAPAIAIAPPPQPKPPPSNSDTKYAFELIAEIGSFAEDMPERGEEFATSVLDKTRHIEANIERFGRVTDGQISALENMRDGLSRWFHD